MSIWDKQGDVVSNMLILQIYRQEYSYMCALFMLYVYLTQYKFM